MSIRHMSTSIAGLESMTDYRLKKMAPFISVDGVKLRTAHQVRKMLKEARAQGLEYIPCDQCDNYDERGLCKGHNKENIQHEQ